MKIRSVGIIGGTQGLGARFATYFEKKFPDLEILVSGRETKITNNKIVQKCDLVIFAIPINVTESVIKACLSESRKNQIWADFTSIKQQPVEGMLKSQAQVCGLHPLFGPMPDIEGQPIIYSPVRIENDSLEALLALIANFDLVELEPKEHDDLMGIVQCASHFSDMVMGETLKNSGFDFETIWKVSSPAYRLKLQVMGRIFAQTPGLYADIAIENLSSLKYLQKFLTAAKELETVVGKGGRNDLVDHMNASKDYLGDEFCQQAYRDSRVFLSSFKNKSEPAVKTSEKFDIAIFGEPYSHTDEAAKLVFNDNDSKCYFANIFEVYQAVSQGQVKYGFVPYENSREGAVFQTLDGLFNYPDILITHLIKKPIIQNLLGISGTKISELQTIISHPQALAQSKDFIREQCPEAMVKNEASTAVAGQIVQTQMDQSLAAIGSEELANSLGLEVLAHGIQGKDNYTSFIKIERIEKIKEQAHTSFVFWFTGDQSGNLAQVLSILANSNINLVKLDSRRASKEFGHYLFFVDALIRPAEFDSFLSEIKKIGCGLRLLGSY